MNRSPGIYVYIYSEKIDVYIYSFHSLNPLFKVCDYVKENGTYDGEDEEDEYDEHHHRIVREEFDEHGHRVRRQATGELYMDLRQTRCPLLLVADYR